MTIPITRSAPGVRLSDAALADLRLHLSGVRLPWAVLGGSVASQAEASTATPGLVGVAIGSDLDRSVSDQPRLLLLDGQNTPVAAMVGPTTIHAGPVGTVALGDIEALTRTPPLTHARDHDRAGCLVVVAMRPWLTADTAALQSSGPMRTSPPRSARPGTDGAGR